MFPGKQDLRWRFPCGWFIGHSLRNNSCEGPGLGPWTVTQPPQRLLLSHRNWDEPSNLVHTGARRLRLHIPRSTSHESEAAPRGRRGVVLGEAAPVSLGQFLRRKSSVGHSNQLPRQLVKWVPSSLTSPWWSEAIVSAKRVPSFLASCYLGTKSQKCLRGSHTLKFNGVCSLASPGESTPSWEPGLLNQQSYTCHGFQRMMHPIFPQLSWIIWISA